MSSRNDRIEYLDALRGFAILGVILTHAASLVGLGGAGRQLTDAFGTGVQLFFVISAFTIFLTYNKALAREAAPTANFFTRRLLRIVPVYWAGIALYTAVYGLASRGWRPGPELWHYPLHLTLTNLLHPAAMSSVVPGGWSISCEVIFYLTAPIWIATIRNVRSALAFLVLSIVVGFLLTELLKASITPYLPITDAGEMRQYWYRSFPSQLGCFGFGILLNELVRADHPTLHVLRMPAVNLGVMGFATAAFVASAYVGLLKPVHHYVAALAYFSAALCLTQIPWRPIVNGATRFVGSVSYSAYLIHFLVLYQLYQHLPLPGDRKAATAVLFALGTAITLPLARLGFRYVETPSSALAKAIVQKREHRRGSVSVQADLQTAP